MHKLLRKKVNWLGKCLLCKKEPSLCKCGLSKDMGEGMGTTTTNLQMSKGKDMHPIIKRSLKCGLSKDMGMDGMPSESDGMMMMSEKRLPKKTKKSENFIDLKNENIPGKRIKNVGGAGYTPGEKKIEKIKAKGSGGELDKSEKSLSKGGKGSGPHKEGVMTDYSHMLSPEHQKMGHKLHAVNIGNHFHSQMTNGNELIGNHAGVHGALSGVLTPEHTYVHPNVQGGGKKEVSNYLHGAAKVHHQSAMSSKTNT